MSRVEAVTGAINSVVQLIVSLPKHARITTRLVSDAAGREVVCFEIDVHECDRGKLIGKGGANMRALRVLLNSAGYLSGVRYRVNCKDESEAGPAKTADSKFEA